uniref:Uncharacterized protein n=1 Tax=Cyanistes caeruleus TaxID=156563 RepID=A0A8C0U8S3_CYACU
MPPPSRGSPRERQRIRGAAPALHLGLEALDLDLPVLDLLPELLGNGLLRLHDLQEMEVLLHQRLVLCRQVPVAAADTAVSVPPPDPARPRHRGSPCPEPPIHTPTSGLSLPCTPSSHPNIGALLVLNPQIHTPTSGLSLLCPRFIPPVLGLSLLHPQFIPPVLGLSLLHPQFIPPLLGLSLLRPQFIPPVSGLSLLHPRFIPPVSGLSLLRPPLPPPPAKPCCWQGPQGMGFLPFPAHSSCLIPHLSASPDLPPPEGHPAVLPPERSPGQLGSASTPRAQTGQTPSSPVPAAFSRGRSGTPWLQAGTGSASLPGGPVPGDCDGNGDRGTAEHGPHSARGSPAWGWGAEVSCSACWQWPARPAPPGTLSTGTGHTWRELWLPPTRRSPWHPRSSAPGSSGSRG